METEDLKMMDGSSSHQSYIRIGGDENVEIGIKPNLCMGPSSMRGTLMLRVARREGVDPDGLPEWSAVLPGVNWEVENERRARTTVRNAIDGIGTLTKERLDDRRVAYGDFVFRPMLDSIYEVLPRSQRKAEDANDPDAVYAALKAQVDGVEAEQVPEIAFHDVVWGYALDTEHDEEEEEETAY